MLTYTVMKRHNLYLPDQLVADARKLASRHGIALADVIRTALEKYLQAVKRAEETRKAEIRRAVGTPTL